jgi:N-glycosylase/DNA lyase
VSGASESQFWELFGLADGLAEAAFADDPVLVPIVRRWPGLRQTRPSDPIEVFASFLCTPNNHLPRITAMVATLGSLGIEVGPGLRRFPSLCVLAELTEPWLRERGFGYRARTLPLAFQAAVERGGEAWFGSLRVATRDEARAALQELPGVGPKLADCIALYGLGHDDAVPVDTHLWQAAKSCFPELDAPSLTPTAYAAVGDLLRARYGRRAGWAHLYLYYDHLRTWRAR